VGIPDAAHRLDKYPHEFSGGQKQRIMIAMSLLLEPSLLIADEITSALDVTLEAQILELLQRLRERRGTGMVFISHDLGVVSQVCDRVIVMYAGQVVEEAPSSRLFRAAAHPYTRALLGAIPSRRHRGGKLVTIPGRVPALGETVNGCVFGPRCSQAEDVCAERTPELVHNEAVSVRCFMFDPETASRWRDPSHLGQPRSEPNHPEMLTTSEAGSDTHLNGENGRSDASLVEINDLETHFRDRQGIIGRARRKTRGAVHAVDGVNLQLRRGEVLGLVGESGSGKTTLAETMLKLVSRTGGEVLFSGEDVNLLHERNRSELRRRAQIVFQDPHASLSPRRTVESLLLEPYVVHGIPGDHRPEVAELMSLVGLTPDLASKFPSQLSGGQARRVGIARALALHPELVVADEPTAGLDASTAAAVLNLMLDIQRRFGLTYVVITHNLNVVGYLADRIAVMYLGQLVEIGPAESVLDHPLHPYTKSLLEAVPEVEVSRKRTHRLLAPGEIPSARTPPSGCRFHTRCAFAREDCKVVRPKLEMATGGTSVACHHWREIESEASRTATRSVVERIDGAGTPSSVPRATV
jgi:oligopeptide/dipeptide ABC transporter ATP-binding protein